MAKDPRRKQFIHKFQKLRKSDHIPQVGSDSRCVVLIPVWQLSPKGIMRIYARGAAFALRSWRAFSDAKAFNVKTFIHTYAEDTELYETLLKENVDPEDIFVDDRPKRRQTFVAGPGFSNKLYALTHPDFEDSEYIAVTDCDTFVLGSYQKPLPFFEALHKTDTPLIGAFGEHRMAEHPWYLEQIRGDLGNETAFMEPAVIERLSDPEASITFIQGAFFAVHRPTFLSDGWWENTLANETSGDDEYLMMLYEASAEENRISDLQVDLESYSWVNTAEKVRTYFKFGAIGANVVEGMPSFIFHPECSIEYLVEQMLRQ